MVTGFTLFPKYLPLIETLRLFSIPSVTSSPDLCIGPPPLWSCTRVWLHAFHLFESALIRSLLLPFCKSSKWADIATLSLDNTSHTLPLSKSLIFIPISGMQVARVCETCNVLLLKIIRNAGHDPLHIQGYNSPSEEELDIEESETNFYPLIHQCTATIFLSMKRQSMWSVFQYLVGRHRFCKYVRNQRM